MAITIDASGSSGMDFEAFIRGGFISDATGGGFPVFDNSAAFEGEEMVIGYGAGAASKYVLAHGDVGYFFGTHTVHGEINTIEYGTRGSGAYDTNGYFTRGNVELRITGLEFANGTTPEADVEATGPVHNFSVAHMYGASADPDRLDLYADQLDAYAQNFIGSAGGDTFSGGNLADTIGGGDGADTLTGGAGDDGIDGGSGLDIALYEGNAADYEVTFNDDGTVTVEDIRATPSDGSDTLKNVEQIQFADETTDLSYPPTVPTLSNSAVREDAAIGTVVGALSSTDPEGGAVTYSLTDDADGLFEIVGNEVRVAGALDHESATSHSISVTVTDEDGNETEKTFAIEVRDVVESPEGTLTIDASGSVGGVNFPIFLANFYGNIETGSSTFYGGTPDFFMGQPVPPQNGKQVGFRWAGSNKQVLVESDGIAYDFIHHGAQFGHGISGAIDSVTFGTYDASTVPGPDGLLENVNALIKISGFDLASVPGAGNSPDNVVYALYDALRKGLDGDLTTTLGKYALDIEGSGGNDVFVGSGFDDAIVGNKGYDSLTGGAGSDSLSGGLGLDTLDGGVGNDTLEGGEKRDILNGGSGDDLLDGGAAKDSLHGGIGDDTLFGGVGSDTLTGGAGADQLDGGAGSNSLNGGAGADTLVGGGGADTLEGAGGRDVLEGGAGADTFIFALVGSLKSLNDTIGDFNSAQGDRIDLSTLAGEIDGGGDFSFIETGPFGEVAGEIRARSKDGNTLIQVDLDGDGSLDFRVTLTGDLSIAAGDFIL